MANDNRSVNEEKQSRGFKLRLFGAILVLFSALVTLFYTLSLEPLRISIDGIDFIPTWGISFSDDQLNWFGFIYDMINEHYSYTVTAGWILVFYFIVMFILAFAGKKSDFLCVICVGFGILLCVTMIAVLISAAVNGNTYFEKENLFYHLAETVRPNIPKDFAKSMGFELTYTGIGKALSPYVWFSVAAVGGVLCAIGGVKGAKHSVAVTENAQPQSGAIVTGDTISERAQYDEADGQPAPVETQPLEYIKPKISEKGKKGIMIALIVSYALLAVAAVLFVSVPSMGNILVSVGMVKDVQARAYAISIGLMWFAVLPSIGYYFATISPYELSKKNKRVIFGVCAALSAAIVAVYFIVAYTARLNGFTVSGYYDKNDRWFLPLSIVFAVIAIAICYLLTLFRLNPEGINTQKPVQTRRGFFAWAKHIFAMIIYGMKKLAKGILAFKEKRPDVFILISSIALTWFVYFMSFIVAIISLCLVFTVIAMYVGGFIEMCYVPSTSGKITINVNGNNVTLTKNELLSAADCEVYEDKYGHKYYSYDNGKTVVRE